MRHPKNYILPIWLLIFSLFVKGQTKEERFNVNHGVSVRKIDSALKSKLQLLQFDSSIGIVFPAEYATTILSQNNDWQNKQTFTPDTGLIRIVESEITKQYCKAQKTWEDSSWKYDKTTYSRITERKEFKKAKKRHYYWFNFLDTACPKWQHDLRYFDKQFMGYIGKSAQCDHPNPVEVDHPNPEQTDQANPEQTDHPLSCI